MKFSSHVLLQYLIQRHRVDINKINQEMTKYYNDGNFKLTTTPRGKVTAVSLLPGTVKPPLPGKPPANRPKSARPVKKVPPPKITIKKRRVINTPTDGN
jgi:hypothetical protein